MVFRTFLLKYGEIGIKGKNRGQFEDALVAQVRYALEKVEGEFEVSKEQGRIYVNALGTEDSFDAEEVIQALQRVFGLVGICLNVLLFAGKYFAGAVSGSIAIVADSAPWRWTRWSERGFCPPSPEG